MIGKSTRRKNHNVYRKGYLHEPVRPLPARLSCWIQRIYRPATTAPSPFLLRSATVASVAPVAAMSTRWMGGNVRNKLTSSFSTLFVNQNKGKATFTLHFTASSTRPLCRKFSFASPRTMGVTCPPEPITLFYVFRPHFL